MNQSLSTSTDRVLELWSLRFVVVAVFVVLYGLFRGWLRDGSADRQAIAGYIRDAAWDKAYRSVLKHGLLIFDRIFGGRLLWSVRGPMVCLALSFLYSILLFVASWTRGGNGTIGDTVILGSVATWRRYLVALSVLAFSYLAFAGTRSWAKAARGLKFFGGSSAVAGEGAGGWMLEEVTTWSVPVAILLTLFLGGATGGVALALNAVSMNGAIVVGAATVGASTLAISTVATWHYYGETQRGSVIVRALAITIVSATVIASAITLFVVADPVPFLIFWVLLPLCNALWDWPSWAISRALIRALAERPSEGAMGVGRAVLHVLIDLVAALLSIIGLVFSLGFGIGACFGQAKTGALQAAEFSSAVKAVAAAPWNPTNFWITLMLLSTVLPTVLHVVALIGSTLTVSYPSVLRARVAKAISEWREEVHGKHLLDIVALLFTLQWAAACTITLVLGWAVWFVVGLGGEEIARVLMTAATWGASLRRPT